MCAFASDKQPITRDVRANESRDSIYYLASWIRGQLGVHVMQRYRKRGRVPRNFENSPRDVSRRAPRVLHCARSARGGCRIRSRHAFLIGKKPFTLRARERIGRIEEGELTR